MNRFSKISRLGTPVRTCLRRAGLALLVLLLTSLGAKSGLLTVGPNYHRPTNSLPSHYKAAELGAWKEGTPPDQVPRGDWGRLFDDEGLNGLETQATRENQNLKAALARVNEARATARVARGELLPTLSLDPGWTRQRFSPNQAPSFGNITANNFSVPLDFSYEVDLWGRVRRNFEGARAEAQA